jgi:hypothetical protein
VCDQKDLDRVEITEKDVQDALRMPRDFGYHGDLPLGERWSLGPIIRHRDSDILQESNADALERHLEKEHPDLEKDWEITRCGHWAVGWVEHLSFRSVEEDGKTPTKVFKVIMCWFNGLANYPIADDDDYNERCFNQTLENIENDWSPKVRQDVVENWPVALYIWLEENGRSLNESDDGSQYPSDEDALEGLRALKLLDEEE